MFISDRADGSEKVVCNISEFQHASPENLSIISERGDPCCWDIFWEEISEPHETAFGVGPGAK